MHTTSSKSHKKSATTTTTTSTKREIDMPIEKKEVEKEENWRNGLVGGHSVMWITMEGLRWQRNEPWQCSHS